MFKRTKLLQHQIQEFYQMNCLGEEDRTAENKNENKLSFEEANRQLREILNTWQK